MISFTLSIIALIIGYFLYGRFVERVFGPDDRVTPAVSKADGLDYIVMPGWKIFMIQFLNIAASPASWWLPCGSQYGIINKKGINNETTEKTLGDGRHPIYYLRRKCIHIVQ